jgi:hypothetical protein
MADQQSLSETLKEWGTNFTTNTKASLTEMGVKDWIRIIMIVGTYLLIRPQLLKFGANVQAKRHEADAKAMESNGAEIHPNELRSGKKIAIPGVESEDEEEGEVKPGDFGKAARVRQRKFIRKAVEEQERKLADEQAAESDKEIEEYLVD